MACNLKQLGQKQIQYSLIWSPIEMMIILGLYFVRHFFDCPPSLFYTSSTHYPHLYYLPKAFTQVKL